MISTPGDTSELHKTYPESRRGRLGHSVSGDDSVMSVQLQECRKEGVRRSPVRQLASSWTANEKARFGGGREAALRSFNCQWMGQEFSAGKSDFLMRPDLPLCRKLLALLGGFSFKMTRVSLSEKVHQLRRSHRATLCLRGDGREGGAQLDQLWRVARWLRVSEEMIESTHFNWLCSWCRRSHSVTDRKVRGSSPDWNKGKLITNSEQSFQYFAALKKIWNI